MADESTWVQGKIAVDVKYDMQEIGGREGRKERRKERRKNGYRREDKRRCRE